MGFIQREHDRIQQLLYKTNLNDPNRAVIESAQQALAWAADPDCFKSPTGWLHKFYGLDVQETAGTGIQVSEKLPTE